MLNSVILAIFGFLFWIVCAHFYAPYQIGIATTLISVASILMQISTLGFNVSIIKFLPKSACKDDTVNTAIITATGMVLISSVTFLLGVRFFSPKLAFIGAHPWMWLGFLFSTLVITLAQLLNAVYIALRSNGYQVIISTVYSFARMALLPVFVYLVGFGIFIAVAIATLISIVYGFFVLKRKFDFKIRVRFHSSVLREMAGFSVGNYFLSFFNNLYLVALPVIITNKVGPAASAYFYIATSLIAFLYVVPQAAASSMFAEGAHADKHDRALTFKAARILFALLLPAILIYISFGKYILLLYGHSYSANGMKLLDILAVSSIFVSISQLYFTHYRVSNQMLKLNGIVIFTNLLALGLSYAFVRHGLVAVGVAVGGCQAISCILFFVLDNKGPLRAFGKAPSV
jgi:O-antigen/teichoic acid export membrane protein